MKAYENLPEGYDAFYAVDLQKDKKTALLVNVLAILIAAVLFVPMQIVLPVGSMFTPKNGMGDDWFRALLLIVLMVLYMVLHELVHGIAMKLCGTKKVRYGFTGMYAFAGSDDYAAAENKTITVNVVKYDSKVTISPINNVVYPNKVINWDLSISLRNL